MPVLESAVDQSIVRWAKERWPEMVIRKLSTLGPKGTNGDPDRLFLWRGKLLLIEMKAPGGVCTELQLARHEQWRRAGAKVIVANDAATGRRILEQEYGEVTKRKVPKTWRTGLARW